MVLNLPTNIIMSMEKSKTGLKPGPKPGSKRVKEDDKKKGYAASLTPNEAAQAEKYFTSISAAVLAAIKYAPQILAADKAEKIAAEKARKEAFKAL